MIPLVVILTMFTMDIEVSTGLVCPAATTTDGPSVYFEPAAVLNFSQGWHAVIAIPFWKISDYDPGTSGFPDYTGIPQNVPYNWNQFYEERSVCYQIGVRKQTGPVTLQALAGAMDRTFKLGYTGADIDAYVTTESYESTDFTGSFNVSIPAGSSGILSAGLRYFDSQWSFSLSTGISFSRLIGGSND